MERREFAILAAAMKTTYHKEKDLMPNQEAMEIWYQHLCDIPFPVAEAALHKWTQTNKWSPSIAELREVAATVSNGEIADWGEGWEKVLKAIRTHGMYNISGALASLDPMTRQAVERVGFREICMSENISVERANFRMVYENLAEREKTRQQVALPLQKAIERLGSADMLALGEGVTK